MSARRQDCSREREVLDLVRAGRWPHSCDDELRAHVAACVSCEEAAHIASLMTADFHAAVRSARVPTSGVVWWRAQRRAREEAEHAAARAVTAVQAISVAIGVAVAIVIAGAMSSLNITKWLGGFTRAFSFLPGDLLSATTLTQWSIPLLVALTVWLTLAPVAVYLAVSRD
jgi:hypothetical protein